MLIVLILFGFLVNFVIASEKVDFTKAFVNSQNKPTTLVVFQNCFDTTEKTQLMERSFFSTFFLTEKGLSESSFEENPQHLLFIVDIGDKKSAESIANVLECGFVCLPILKLSQIAGQSTFFRASLSVADVPQ